jgi:hypothetical protein
MIESNRQTRVIAQTTIREHFQTSVTTALNNQGVDAATETTCYLINLLTSFLHTEQLYERSEDGLNLKPLALIYTEAAQETSPEQRNRAMRRLGDVALFIAGVFADSLSRKPVDVDYYIAMGGSAYAQLSDNLTRSSGARALRGVFAELAAKFTRFVDVLAEVTEQANCTSSTDILRVYEVWLRTGSQRAAQRLRDLGIQPSMAASISVSH